jgi:hypothetical protein
LNVLSKDGILKNSLFTLLLLSFSLTANAGLFGSDCPDVKPSKTPDWVKAGFEYQEPGYRHGFGQARFKKRLSYDQLLSQAEQQARQDLVNSIHIKVDASTGVSTLVENGATGETISRRSENKIETSSKLDLPGLPIHQQWQDADSCSVYVQVRIANAMVTLVLQRTQAETYLADAQNEAKQVKLRLFAIDEAIRLANQFEFNQIPAGLSSEQMLRKFQHVREELLRTISMSNHVYFIVNHTGADDTGSLNALRNTMKSSMSGSFETGKQCSSPAICINHAGNTSANYASVAVVRMESSKQNGFWIGNFEIEMSLWNLADNTRLYNSGALAARVMNRHQHKLTINSGFNKWQQLHKNSLVAYQQKAAAVK